MPKIILDIGSAIGEQGADPVGLQQALWKEPGNNEVHASANLQGKDIPRRTLLPMYRESTVDAMRLTN
jgi:hypothetical protein